MIPTVSIIVPVFNVERYLHDCINSVLNQSYSNLELILVDDGSTDQGGRICDEYAEKDNRVKVKHIRNSGVSYARNTGINMANGKWLLFLDGDDLLELDTVEYIELHMQKHKDLDMLLGGFKYIYENRVDYADNDDRYYEKGVDVIHDYGLWKVKICIGSFIVKKQVIQNHNILFNLRTKYGEDVEFINYCLLHSSNVRITSKYFNNYVIHKKSAIAKITFDRYDCFEAKNRTLIYILGQYPDYKNIELLYKERLLPEAIIDTTYLLCNNGINLFKIVKFLKENDYYRIINSANQNTPNHIKKKIDKFVRYPFRTWLECFALTQYYKLRHLTGLLKRRVLK